jgi:transcription initiation factor TFIIIB Brf1 subunit/transcription initiation factor TFIIB
MPPGHFVYSEDDPHTPRCSDCKWTKFVEDRAEGCITCCRCGLVVEDHIMVDDGFHHKTNDQGYADNVHYGAPINPFLSNSSMSTMIGYGGRCSRLMRNLHQQQAMPSRERSLYHKFKEIREALDNRLHIASEAVSTWAQEIWRDLKDKRVITKGEKNTAMLACCIYYACKLSNLKRTRQDILAPFDLGAAGPRKFKQASALLLANVQDRYYYPRLLEDHIAPDDYVVRMLAVLRIGGARSWDLVKEVRRMNAIVEESEKMANLHTTTVLATLLYVAAHATRYRTEAGEALSLEHISLAYGVNVQTLKSKLRVLLTIEPLEAQARAAMAELSRKPRGLPGARAASLAPAPGAWDHAGEANEPDDEEDGAGGAE